MYKHIQAHRNVYPPIHVSCNEERRSCCSTIRALRRDIKTSIKLGRTDLETNMTLRDTVGFKEHGDEKTR